MLDEEKLVHLLSLKVMVCFGRTGAVGGTSGLLGVTTGLFGVTTGLFGVTTGLLGVTGATGGVGVTAFLEFANTQLFPSFVRKYLVSP